MAVLVGYASSESDEDVDESTSGADAQAEQATASRRQESRPVANQESNPKVQELAAKSSEAAKSAPVPDQDDVMIGPVQQYDAPLGPSLPPLEGSFPPVPLTQDGETPASPYSANRALLRHLTLPSVPNLDIPASPPGSPPPETNKRFEQFLELKKKGTHFNAKLAASAALKNPAVMDKLLNYVELDEQDQYATTLPPDVWNPAGFPEWAFRGQLRKSQDKVRKEREAEKAKGQRGALDFVPASGGSTGSTPTARPGGLSKGEKRKARWD